MAESTSTTTVPEDVISQLPTAQHSTSDVRTEAPPTNGAPPSGPPVSLKPCLRPRLPSPYDKRKRHPSNGTDSVTPVAKLKPVPISKSLNSHTVASPEATVADNYVIATTKSPEISPRIETPATKTSSYINLCSEMPPEFHAIQPATTKPKKTITFADPLINDLSSLSLQSDDQPTADMQMQPWAMVATEKIDTTLPEDHDFGATNRTAWNLIKDQLILAEKCHGRATLAHNARLVERLLDWSLGMRKIPSLMIPNSKWDAYFTLLQKQAVEKLHFMEEVLSSEADLCDCVAAIHTETMTRCLETEDDKRLFPLMRNRITKLARSRSASYTTWPPTLSPR